MISKPIFAFSSGYTHCHLWFMRPWVEHGNKIERFKRATLWGYGPCILDVENNCWGAGCWPHWPHVRLGPRMHAALFGLGNLNIPYTVLGKLNCWRYGLCKSWGHAMCYMPRMRLPSHSPAGLNSSSDVVAVHCVQCLLQLQLLEDANKRHH